MAVDSVPRIFDDEELNELAFGAIAETKEEFENVLPDIVQVRWRRYGRGGRWEVIGPRSRVSTPHGEDDAILQAWWIVTMEVIAARMSDAQRTEMRALLDNPGGET